MASYLVPCDPAHERFDAMARCVVTGAVAATAAVLVVAVLDLVGTVQGWLLLATAVPPALAPLARWYRHARRRDRLPVGHLEPAWRDALATAAAATERIGLVRRQSPPGAVAAHLSLVHDTARHHLAALHRSATVAAPLDPASRRALLRDDARTVRRLVELADAAERLGDAQRRLLEPDPLAALAETTDRLAASLGSDALRHDGDLVR